MSEIRIFNDIGVIRAESVSALVSSAKEGEPLNVRINSDGGVVTEGIAIYNALRSARPRTVGTVEGIAASMSSVILQACDVRRMREGAFLMIHNPQGGAKGESSDLRRAADVLDKMRESLIDIYMRRAKCSREKLGELLDAETWLTAEESVAIGLADEIVSDEADLKAVAKMQNIPEKIRASLKGKSMSEEEKEKMKALEETCAALKAELEEMKKAKAESDEDEEPKDEDGEGEEKKEDEEAEAKARVFAVAQRLTGHKSAGAIEGALMALGHSQMAGKMAAREEFVAKLVSSGKLAPHAKSWALEASDRALKAYCDTIGDGSVIPTGSIKMGEAPKASSTISLTDDEKRLAGYMGLSEEEALKAKKG